MNFHKRCAYKIPNNCNSTRHRRLSSGSSNQGSPNNAESLVGFAGCCLCNIVFCGKFFLSISLPLSKPFASRASKHEIFLRLQISRICFIRGHFVDYLVREQACQAFLHSICSLFLALSLDWVLIATCETFSNNSSMPSKPLVFI